MKYNSHIHHRRSIRLRGYDYSQAGAYFVTICTRQRDCIFGNVVNGKMVLNNVGQIVADEWIKTAEIRNNIELDEWVVMPNHFHGILVVVDGRDNRHRGRTVEQFGQPVSGSIPTIIRAFKSAVTKRFNESRGGGTTVRRGTVHRAPTHRGYTNACRGCINTHRGHTATGRGPIWQRNYYEHIIHSKNELNRIRKYIINNPIKWESDRDNTNQIKY